MRIYSTKTLVKANTSGNFAMEAEVELYIILPSLIFS